MRVSELNDDREAVAAFIDTVSSRLNSQTERFVDDLNKFVETHKTYLATTTDIRPTVATVRQT